MAPSDRTYDITIIGSGPGGYVAAIRAAQLGMKTAVVETDALPGGTCLHRGCIPAKALLQSAEVLETARRASRFGVELSQAGLDMAAVHRYRKKTVLSNAKGVEFLFRKNGVTMIRGRGRLAGRGRVEVTPGEGEPYVLESPHVVLATGSEVHSLPGIELDGRSVISSDEALELEEVPESLVIVGAGAVGVEFASLYATFGSKVTVVEMLDRLVPLEDRELGAELERAFRKRGIVCHTGTRVDRLSVTDDGVTLSARKGDEELDISAGRLLLAVGRKPRTEGLGLEGTGVRLERGFVEVDSLMRTGEPGVYAVGDIVATPALAHVASHEGIVAVEHAAGASPRPVDYDRVPSCIFCRPEIASVGLSEEAARERGHVVAVGKFPFAAIGKAKILEDTGGFVKIVAEKEYDQVLGVHIIGPHATELISEGIAALNLEATAESLFHAVHAHPTLHEALAEAALGVHGRSLHI